MSIAPARPEVPDRVLADRVRAGGDESAFRTLYGRHTPAIYQFALRLAGGHEPDAEDVVQETWFRAVERLDGFRWEANLRTWLRAIALNVWRRRMRDRSPNWLPIEDDLLPGPAPVDPADRLDLERALTLLPPGYRAVLLLHDGEGRTHAEIGEALGISEGTSKSQLWRARTRLRTLLSPPEDEQLWRTTNATTT